MPKGTDDSEREDGELDDDDIEIFEVHEEPIVLSDGSDDFNVEAKIKQEEIERKKARKKAKKEKKEKKREKESKKYLPLSSTVTRPEKPKIENHLNGYKKPPQASSSFNKSLDDRACEELLRDARVSKIRGESSGTWHCGLNKTNKRFLQSAIVQTVNHNRREESRHRERSSRKLEQLDRRRERYPDEKYDDYGRRYVRNPLSHPRARPRRDYESDRYRNAERKSRYFPLLEPREMKFVKPRDLDDRVLIPGKPVKARVKQISFICPKAKEEQFLGHDSTDLRMERIRQLLSDKIPKQEFVPPELPSDKFFTLSGNKVAGLIRKASEDPEPKVKYPVTMQTPCQEWPATYSTTNLQPRQLIHSSWPVNQKDAWTIPTSNTVPTLLPPPPPPELPEFPIVESVLPDVTEEELYRPSAAKTMENLESIDAVSDVDEEEHEDVSDLLPWTVDEFNALLYKLEVCEDTLQAWQTMYFPRGDEDDNDSDWDFETDGYVDDENEDLNCEKEIDDAFVFIDAIVSSTFTSDDPPLNPLLISNLTSISTNLSKLRSESVQNGTVPVSNPTVDESLFNKCFSIEPKKQEEPAITEPDLNGSSKEKEACIRSNDESTICRTNAIEDSGTAVTDQTNNVEKKSDKGLIIEGKCAENSEEKSQNVVNISAETPIGNC